MKDMLRRETPPAQSVHINTCGVHVPLAWDTRSDAAGRCFIRFESQKQELL